MDFGIASVAAITVIAYLVGFAWKVATRLDNKWIPVVCGLVGLVLGIAAFFFKIPDFPGADVITAAAVGIVSGLAATGAHEMAKQLSANSQDAEDADKSTK